jgi:hypothetical protein
MAGFDWLSKVRANGPSYVVDRAVLLVLVEHMNEHGRAWPSMARIAAHAGITERSARRRVRALEADGWLAVEGGGGRHRTNVYRVNRYRLSTGTDDPGNPDETRTEKPGLNPDVDDRNPDVDDRNPDGASAELLELLEHNNNARDDALPFVVGVRVGDEGTNDNGNGNDDAAVAAFLVAVMDRANVPDHARPNSTARVRLALRAAVGKGHTADTFAARLMARRIDYSRVGPGLVAETIETVASGPLVTNPTPTPEPDAGPLCHECGQTERACRRVPRPVSGHAFVPDSPAEDGHQNGATTNDTAARLADVGEAFALPVRERRY